MKCYTAALILLVISLGCSCEKKNLNVPLLLIEELHAEENTLRAGGKRSAECGEGQTACLDGQTCCVSYSGGYGCCPVPNAVCCDNGVYCCPRGFVCDYRSGGCRKEAGLFQSLKRTSSK